MIISGLRWVAKTRAMVAYTGLFSSNGSVLKKIDWDVDPDNPNPETQSQPSVSPTEDKSATQAVSRAVMQLAGDKNVYW